MSKKTLVLGASPNPDRYGFIATQHLLKYTHEVVPVGNKKGNIEGLDILLGMPEVGEVDTVTLYLNPTLQEQYYDYIIGLAPKRIIFNPGTENPALVQLAKKNNIEPVIACTLVMLAVGDY